MDVVSYMLSKRYVDESLTGVGALAGKSAYEIAQDNGFTGTEAEWLESLKGESPDLEGYATEDYVEKTVVEAIKSAPLPDGVIYEGGEI